MTPTPFKKPSVRKPLCLFTTTLDAKKKTATRQVGSTKSNCKAIKYRTKPWALKKNRIGNSEINDQIKKSLYNLIMHHPQVVQSPILNNFLKVKIDGYTEFQLVPIFLLQVSAQ